MSKFSYSALPIFDLTLTLNYCSTVPTPTVGAEIVGEAVEGNQFAASCYATVIAGIPNNSVQIRFLNPFGFEISNFSTRVVVTPVIQLNETTFVRTVSLNPITTFDTGNYSCVAVVQGAYHTSGVASLNTSLVVQRKFSYKEYNCEWFKYDIHRITCQLEWVWLTPSG